MDSVTAPVTVILVHHVIGISIGSVLTNKESIDGYSNYRLFFHPLINESEGLRILYPLWMWRYGFSHYTTGRVWRLTELW